MYARAIEADHLIALVALVLVQLNLTVLNNLTFTILRDDAQNHLGAVVPYAVILVGIVPRHANGIGPLVLPLSIPGSNA